MVVDKMKLLKAAEIVAQQEQMKANLQWSAAGGLLAGVSAFCGGLVMGPVGLLAGGTLGGLASMFVAQNRFKSVFAIIKEDLTPEQRDKLAEMVEEAFKNFDVTTDVLPIVAAFIAAPSKEAMLMDGIKGAMITFFMQELHMRVESGNDVNNQMKLR